MRNQTLVNRTGEQGDAVVADLVTEALAGHADPCGAGGSQDVDIQVLPLLSGSGRWHRADSRHRWRAGTPVLLVVGW